MNPKITVAFGDGIGPEIMQASLDILKAGGGSFDVEAIEIGEKVYLQGHSSGIRPEDWATLNENKIFYKAPITTPQGGGYKSLNVTLRKTLGLYANVRPTKSLSPFVPTKHPDLDVVVIRENEEDLYAGIEHRQTPEVYQCLKLISRPGSEKIIRYAFEYAKATGRKKVTCMIKDNIMKLTDGLFHKVFREIAAEYPNIKSDHMIIDIGMAKAADSPEMFDVIVLPNLYGDIISDILAQISGSVGLGGSCNLGEKFSMFEAIHGSAPDIAGKEIANPSGLLMAGVMMLNHLGQNEAASRIENAWLKTIEDGYHTADIFRQETSKKKLSTSEFSRAVIENLGQLPERLSPVDTRQKQLDLHFSSDSSQGQSKPDMTLDGIDIFLFENDRDPERLGNLLEKAVEKSDFKLLMITNRGVKVFPDGHPETFCTDHWRCRFVQRHKNGSAIDQKQLVNILSIVTEAGFEFIKCENLYSFDGEPGYSLGQGQ